MTLQTLLLLFFSIWTLCCMYSGFGLGTEYAHWKARKERAHIKKARAQPLPPGVRTFCTECHQETTNR